MLTDENVDCKALSRAGTLHPLDLADVTLGGEFGRRVERMIEANILKIDVEETFLAEFRQRGKGGYIGFGKFIDAVVRLAAAGDDPRLLVLRKTLRDELLTTQESDGYIGVVEDPQLRLKVLWDLHESAYLIWLW